MRITMSVAAVVAAVAAAAPAEATWFDVTIYATVSGTQFQVICNDLSNPACVIPSAPFVANVSSYLGPLNLNEGANSFDDNPLSARVGGYFTGTIINNQGYLTGINLFYGRDTCGVGVPARPCYNASGTAPTFTVIGGIPEAATWAMMVTGFGAVGHAMRRRRRVRDASGFRSVTRAS